ncbi:MAG: stealth conserved region 3 domain-containing protein, partial [Puniceicoccales bacterium]|nr:stealth conserved region 3 domain-containing protein [Puniceicoccales bacterium]
NSHVIEACLHRITDLSEHYIYFNDDVFLGTPTRPQDFFCGNGMAHKFYSPKRILLDPDNPTQMANLRVQACLKKEYGLTIQSFFLHLVHTQQRSVAEAIERRWPEIYGELLTHRFRSPEDWTVATLLHPYVAFLEGKALMNILPKMAYVQLGSCGYKLFLKKILQNKRRNPYKIFCLNEAL